MRVRLLGVALFFVTRPSDIPFEKHTIDLGASETAAVADIDGDGKLDIISGENLFNARRRRPADLDIVTAGKSGLFLFENMIKRHL